MTGRDGDGVIRSADNQTLKLIRSLRQRHVREAERAFVVEGTRAVEDALDAGGRARVVIVREGSVWPVDVDVPVRHVEPRLFDRLAETETPQPVIAVFEVPRPPAPAGEPFVLVADGIQDPGNLGTLIRSAAAAGATAVAVTPGTVDPYNGKAVRAAMGCHFRISIRRVDEASLVPFERSVRRRILADAEAGEPYDATDWGGSLAVIVGSEAHGPTDLGRRMATGAVRIPLAGGVDSLNAGVAGSILLFEAARQRRAAREG